MSNILVTGASGFIGRQVVRNLIDKGHKVIGINFQHTIEFEHPNFKMITLDLLDHYAVVDFFKNNHFENLIHLAWYGDAKCHVHNINVDWFAASLNILRLFHENGGKKIMIAGSISEYDFEYGCFKEGLTPLNNRSLYGKSKSALYEVAETYCEQNGIDFKWARIFNLYGQYERPERLMPYVITSMLKGEDVKVSVCTKYQDYLHVEDVADALVAFFASDIKGALNICSGEPVRLKTIVEKLRSLTCFRGKVLYGAIPSSFEDPIVVGNNERLSQKLGWEPKHTLDTGLAHCVDWWRKQLNG